MKVWMFCERCEAVILDDAYRLTDNTHHSCRNDSVKTNKPSKLVPLTTEKAVVEVEACQVEIACLKARVDSISALIGREPEADHRRGVEKLVETAKALSRAARPLSNFAYNIGQKRTDWDRTSADVKAFDKADDELRAALIPVSSQPEALEPLNHRTEDEDQNSS